MIVLLVRHADAADRTEFQGNDMARPLTADGERKATEAAKYLKRLYGHVDQVLTSPAMRAQETAAALAKAFAVELETTPLLSPGATFAEFAELVGNAWDPEGTIVLVGHEPDFSIIVGQATASGSVNIKVSKMSCVELDVRRNAHGKLRKLLPFSVMCA